MGLSVDRLKAWAADLACGAAIGVVIGIHDTCGAPWEYIAAGAIITWGMPVYVRASKVAP